MRYGGERMIKLYQCGLRGSARYSGEIDGVLRPELTEALRKCVGDKACEPLPPGESRNCHNRGRLVGYWNKQKWPHRAAHAIVWADRLMCARVGRAGGL